MGRGGREVPVALTIAGSDSGGGAGIEADLKTFSSLGVHGVVALTSITAQNTREVREIYNLPPRLVKEQVLAVVEDLGVDAAKTGMLGSVEIVNVVADIAREYNIPLVVDPVMYSKSGSQLLESEGIIVLREKLIPLAKIVTPNIPEAEELTGLKIGNVEDAVEAAKRIVEVLGAEAAVVKGGHLRSGGEVVDVLYYDGKIKKYKMPYINSKNTHGTGCVFSAAITAEIAKNKTLEEAVDTAKKLTYQAILYGLNIGKGHGPVNPTSWLGLDAERYRVIQCVEKALERLVDNGRLVSRYVPEVQMNLVMALPREYARSVNDVAGVLGRIVRVGDKVKPSGPVVFGASKHLARAVLKIMEYDPNVRAALNLRYCRELVDLASRIGLTVSWYDRREEPEESKKVEGSTIPWGVSVAIEKAGKIPDLIYHLGDWGKEPMINVFGRDAIEVVEKTLKLLSEVESGGGS